MRYLNACWYWLRGLYLRFSGGEIPRWLPVIGEHHLFTGIRFQFGEIHFTDAKTLQKRSVRLVDPYGEAEMLATSGEIVRLLSSGARCALLVHPDGVTTERLRCNQYSTEIRRHGLVSYFVTGRMGGATAAVFSGGYMTIGKSIFSLTSSAPWKFQLPDGSVLEYRPSCQLVHQFGNRRRAYLWAAKQDRLLRVDYHRKELRFAWVTHESQSPTSVLDGLVELYPEDGSVKCLHHSTYARGDAIEFHGPNDIRVVRDEGSDTLWAWQGKSLIGVCEFVLGAGIDREGLRYDRFRFSAGSAEALPQGEPWICPLTTAAVATVPVVAVLALHVSETVALATAVPVVVVITATVTFRTCWLIVRHIFR